VIGGAHGAIAESSVAQEAFMHYRAPADRILRAVLPFDVSWFHDRTIRVRRSPEFSVLRGRYPGPMLLSVGQLIPRKGCRQMLEIYRRLSRARPDLSLVMVGDGPERGLLERMARALGLRHVFFEGHIQPDALPQYLACADLFVFHTLYDSFGLVLGEAMAAELPVASSVHAAATRDLVEEGVTGCAIDPRDAEGSAAAILNLLEMPQDVRSAMGRAAYERVRTCDAEVSASRMATFMQRVLEMPAGPVTEEGWGRSL
jgi:glycosyltransferase involved in cell wall biosynthesis